MKHRLGIAGELFATPEQIAGGLGLRIVQIRRHRNMGAVAFILPSTTSAISFITFITVASSHTRDAASWRCAAMKCGAWRGFHQSDVMNIRPFQPTPGRPSGRRSRESLRVVAKLLPDVILRPVRAQAKDRQILAVARFACQFGLPRGDIDLVVMKRVQCRRGEGTHAQLAPAVGW